ncbi:copper amine oxidase N-terminal domain-containing protein [Bernardetia sp. ABR2-2B]|uniref:copper amine oxidase N-terminal domain-containing protein n=1 Tax=Bernardetia sp. ABR2-2B TaxID=3127472 RepID=UPI0030CCCCFF
MKLIKLNLSYIVFLLVIAIGFTSCQEDDILEHAQKKSEQIEENSDPAISSTSKKGKSNQETHTASSTVRVLVNGNPLTWPNNRANPVNVNGRVMVHMNTIFTRLGYSVQWIQNDPNRGNLSSVVATKPGRTIQIWVGDTWAKVNGSWKQAAVAPYNNNGYVMVHSRFVAENSGSRTDWDQQTTSVQIYYYDEPDYGFYFFGSQPGSNPTADAVGCQKFVPGVANPFFDPTKPTIIYVHGNAPNAVQSQSREDFLLDEGGLNVQSHNIWKAQGWNVAIFYWIQFADEGNNIPPYKVEKKIYTANSEVGMRWKGSNGNMYVSQAIQRPVKDLFAEEYRKIFTSSYSGAEIRVVGNSLGGNLTMAGLLEVYRRNSPRLPSRITLMDPFWTAIQSTGSPQNSWYISGFDENVTNSADYGGLSAEIYAARGTAIEYFRTSLLGANGLSARAGRASAVCHFGIDFLGSNPTNQVRKHTIPVRQYFHSRGVAAPLEVSRPNILTSWSPTGNQAMSAATPNSRIRQMMVPNTHWNQLGGNDGGRGTATMADDRYHTRLGLW